MLSGEKGLDVIVKKMSLDLLPLGSWMNLVIFVDIIKKDQQQKRKTYITSVPLGICCTARTTANLSSNTKIELGKQL